MKAFGIEYNLTNSKQEEREPLTSTWWFSPPYDDWDLELDDAEWLKNSDDLPHIRSLIEVTNPDGIRWLTLEGDYIWEQPTSPEEERFEIQRREIWYKARSYIVKKPDMDKLFK